MRMQVTTVSKSWRSDAKEHIRVFTHTFSSHDVELVECTLDAAWTCFKEGRPEQARLLLEEVVFPEDLQIWLMAMPSMIHTPVIAR